MGWTPTADNQQSGDPPYGDRQLHARNGESIYQSAGNQIFFHHQPAVAHPTPANILPRDTAAFTGRDKELSALVDTVGRSTENGTIVPLYAIDGMPGVGKSAFVVHAGHMLQDQFADGQFHIDLHAHSAGQRPADPADALFRLLSADGVRPAEIPPALEDRAALWRKRMAGRRALVILDNAESRKQVQPLLPGAGRGLVMITSRSRLTGLIAQQAPVTLTLDTLPPEDATRLFATLANRHLQPAEAEAVDELMRLCGYLPLAICLLATPLRLESQWPITGLVRELSQVRHRLSRMRAEDVAVEAAFGLSYRRLTPSQRRFFRRLGLHPGLDVDQYAAAALDGSSPRRAGKCLRALYDQHLLDQPTPGRFRMHDLIREYAAMRAESGPTHERDGAVARLLDYYRRATEAAGRQLRHTASRPAVSNVLDPDLPPIHSREQAMAWMKQEQANLFACASIRPPRPEDGMLPALAAAMAPYLRLAGPWDLAIALHEAAAAAAEAAGDRRATADALCELGVLRRHVGQYAAAQHALEEALQTYEAIGHRLGAAEARTELGGVRWRSGHHREAVANLRAALATYRDLYVPRGQARALHELGIALWAGGGYAEALEASEEALRICAALGDRQGVADALHQIGGLQQLTVGYTPAIDVQERALALYRDLGDRLGEAKALGYLGAAYRHTGDYEASHEALTRALAIQRDLGYGRGEAHTLNYLGILHRDLGRYAAARQLLTDALARYRELGYRNGHADVLNQIGVLERLTGDHAASAESHRQALGLFRQVSDDLGQSEVLSNLGELLLALGRPDEAHDRYRQALELATRARNPNAEANALSGAGRSALRLNDPEKGTELLRRAQETYQRIGALKAAKAVAELLGNCPP